MFNQIGQFANLLKQLPKIKEEMAKLHQRVSQISAEGDAGAGMVKVRVNGKMELLSCTFSDDALKTGDREMIEDLTKAAVNQALARAKQLAAEETAKLAASLGLPSGLDFSGFSLPGS